MGLWFGISVPLCLFGSYFAFKKPVADFPVRTNQIPRQIPDQVWYMHPAMVSTLFENKPF
jgi:transmembrane 9 superfamily protein 2/4